MGFPMRVYRLIVGLALCAVVPATWFFLSSRAPSHAPPEVEPAFAEAPTCLLLPETAGTVTVSVGRDKLLFRRAICSGQRVVVSPHSVTIDGDVVVSDTTQDLHDVTFRFEASPTRDVTD